MGGIGDERFRSISSKPRMTVDTAEVQSITVIDIIPLPYHFVVFIIVVLFMNKMCCERRNCHGKSLIFYYILYF